MKLLSLAICELTFRISVPSILYFSQCSIIHKKKKARNSIDFHTIELNHLMEQLELDTFIFFAMLADEETSSCLNNCPSFLTEIQSTDDNQCTADNC